MNEFDLINKYFNFPSISADLGIGDDAALFNKNKNEFYAISVDTLNLNHHFTNTSDPYYLGWKSLAVNISDIVAMGGMPKYALLSLSILEPEDFWLSKFAKGLRACAKKYNVELIGGDTNKGSPSISITIIGDVLKKNVLRRDQVQIKDEIWLTNEVGYAALHFQYDSIPQKNRQTISNCLKKSAHQGFVKPMPPLDFIQKAKSLIHGAIDVSDGLAGDLQHITLKNGFGAKIYIDKIPMHKWFRENNFYELALTGGEDYQILFTAPVKNNHKINSLLKKFSMKGAMIGHVSNKKSIQYELNGQPFYLSKDGFRHFG